MLRRVEGDAERQMSVPVSQEVSLGPPVTIRGFGGRVALPDKSRVDFMCLLRFTEIKF